MGRIFAQNDDKVLEIDTGNATQHYQCNQWYLIDCTLKNSENEKKMLICFTKIEKRRRERKRERCGT